MTTATSFTSKGQVTVPKHIRDKYGFKTSTKVYIQDTKYGPVIKKAPTLDEVVGIVKVKKPISIKEQKKLIKKAIYKKNKNK